MITGPPVRSKSSAAAPVAGVGLALASLLVIRVLSATGWDPAVLVKVGEVPPEFNAYAREQLGDFPVAAGRGHDGKFYLVQALDPLFIENPDGLVELLDEPAYRAQRMLYPLLAGGGGLLPARATVWGMLAVNLAAVALGCWATGRIAGSLGLTLWAGLGFVLNPGMIFELLIDGAGLLAWALATAGLLALEIGKRRSAIGLLTAASLSRETMLLAVLGAVVLEIKRRRSVRSLLVVPAGAVLLWAAWIRVRLDAGPLLTPPGLDLPFSGLSEVWRSWIAKPGAGFVMGALLVVLAVYLLSRLSRLPHPYLWGSTAFVLLIPLADHVVWAEAFDSSRALAPIIGGASLALLASLRRSAGANP